MEEEAATGHSVRSAFRGSDRPRRIGLGIVVLILSHAGFAAAAGTGKTAPDKHAPSPASPAAVPSPPSKAAATGLGASELGEHLPGQLSSRFAINGANPEASVPSDDERDRNPLEFGYLIQDLLERAEQARKAKDFQGVVRYYRAVAKAVPDNAKGWSKLCEAYELVHDRERAIGACRYAIDRPAVEAQDYVRYVHLILAQPGDLAATAKAELARVLDHLDKQDGVQLIAAHLRCETGVKLRDAAMLEVCTKALAKVAPNDPKTVVFQWSLALMKGRAAEAQELLVRARATGVVAENVARMEEVTVSELRLSKRSRGRTFLIALFLGAAGAATVVAIRRRRGVGGRGAMA